MKRILFLTALLLTLASCSEKTRVDQIVMKLGQANLITEVYYEGEKVSVEFDEISEDKIEEIAVKRRSDGEALIRKLDRVFERKSDYK